MYYMEQLPGSGHGSASPLVTSVQRTSVWAVLSSASPFPLGQ
jgi:hypothetical protein